MAKNRAPRVKTSEVRLSFVHLAEPYKFDPNDANEEGKYSVSAIIRKDDANTLNALKQDYNLAMESGIQKFGEAFKRRATPMIRPQGSNKGILVDCDADDRYKDNADYKGCYIIQAKSKTPAPVYALETGRKQLSTQEIKDLVYSGCYGKVLLNLYPYSNKDTGIAIGLDSVLKTRDGENLGSRVNAMDYFGDDIENAANDLLGGGNDLLGGNDDLPW